MGFDIGTLLTGGEIEGGAIGDVGVTGLGAGVKRGAYVGEMIVCCMGRAVAKVGTVVGALDVAVGEIDATGSEDGSHKGVLVGESIVCIVGSLVGKFVGIVGVVGDVGKTGREAGAGTGKKGAELCGLSVGLFTRNKNNALKLGLSVGEAVFFCGVGTMTGADGFGTTGCGTGITGRGTGTTGCGTGTTGRGTGITGLGTAGRGTGKNTGARVGAMYFFDAGFLVGNGVGTCDGAIDGVSGIHAVKDTRL